MGMTIETLKVTFPKSYKEFQKCELLIDKYLTDNVQRATLKAQMRMLMIVTATEASQAAKLIGALGKLFK